MFTVLNSLQDRLSEWNMEVSLSYKKKNGSEKNGSEENEKWCEQG